RAMVSAPPPQGLAAIRALRSFGREFRSRCGGSDCACETTGSVNTPFGAATHHDVLLLLVQLALLLFAARAFGEIAQRLKQPSVVGEIMAGIILGPSLLSGLVPALGAWIVPHTALGGHLLEVVSLLGALFLLLITGLETDLGLI